jgi:hypothetical protein
LTAIGTPANGAPSPGWISSAAAQRALAVDLDERVQRRRAPDAGQRRLHELAAESSPPRTRAHRRPA